jgi:signal transduction histidine kinase
MTFNIEQHNRSGAHRLGHPRGPAAVFAAARDVEADVHLPAPAGVARLCSIWASSTDGREPQIELRRLLEEQAALRRVARLAAGRAPASEILMSVAEELARLLHGDRGAVYRCESRGAMSVAASWAGEEREPAAGTRVELAGDDASRARIVAAADESRRRIERDLHDGAQQRLISLALALRAAVDDATATSDELRDALARAAQALGTYPMSSVCEAP